MGRIIKALILGWIGKKIYDKTLGSEAQDEVPSKTAAHAKRAAPKRTAHKPTRKAA